MNDPDDPIDFARNIFSQFIEKGLVPTTARRITGYDELEWKEFFSNHKGMVLLRFGELNLISAPARERLREFYYVVRLNDLSIVPFYVSLEKNVREQWCFKELNWLNDKLKKVCT